MNILTFVSNQLQLTMLSYKHTANVFANIVLLVVYAAWFGRQSVQKYLDNAVYITQQEEKSYSIRPPGESLFFKVYFILNHHPFSFLNITRKAWKWSSWMET